MVVGASRTMKEALRVLIADDEALARRVLLHLLARLDLPVEVVGVADNSAEAIDQALILKPDVALLDIRMPGIDGLEAARSIREKLPSCAVILITAYREFDLAKDAIQSGVGCYLVKPVEPEALREALVAVVRAKETEIAESGSARNFSTNSSWQGPWLKRPLSQISYTAT